MFSRAITRNGTFKRFLATAATAASGTTIRKKTNVVFRLTKVTYGTLALIPVSFTIAAGYHHVVGHPRQVSRAYAFFAWTGYLCLPLSVVLLLSAPFVLAFDGEKRTLFDEIQRTWAKLTVLPFFSPEFVGVERHLEQLETLGKTKKGVIYVSNHQSWSDIYSLLLLPFPIRFVSKREIFYIPVVGWVMGLIGHVAVHRKNKESRAGVVEACVGKIRSGVSVFLFAEGTRSRDGFVQPFKKGAFLIAREGGNIPIIPVTISGTGVLMPPNRGETWLERNEDAPVYVEIHDPIFPDDFDSLEELQDETKRIIEQSLL